MRDRKKKICSRFYKMLLVAVFLLSAHSFAADDYMQWPSSAAITLNTTVTGAGVNGNVANFPVLIRLNPGNFSGFASTLPGGSDIRFANTNGTHLAYQIERWVDGANNNDTADIWVKLDMVYGNNSTQSFKIFWGKSGSADSSRAAVVFDTTRGFQGVWHLHDATVNVTDATYHADMGTDIITSTGTTSVTGLIGKARSFSPAQKNAISLGNTPSICSLTDSITVSAWFKTVQPEDTVVSVLRCDGNFTALQIHSTAGQNAFATYWDPTPHATGFPWMGSKYADNQWHYVTSKYKTGSGCRVFMDGSLVAGDSANTGALVASANSFYLGTSGNMEYYRGLLDEVRIEKSYRSPDWIKLCFQNQRSVQTLFSIVVGGAPVITTQPLSQTVTIGQPVTFTVVATGNPAPTYQWRKTGANITGATSASYTIPAVAATDAAPYTVVVTNSVASVTSGNAVLTVNPALPAPSNLTYSMNPASYVVGTAIASNSPTSSGGAVASYSVAPALPLNLTLNTSTGVITGTPTVPTAVTTYTVTARNTAGATTVPLLIRIDPAVAPPTNLFYRNNSVSYVVGVPIMPDTAFVTGTVDSFTVVPVLLPAGLAINKVTGILSGTPTAPTALTLYTVTARNAGGIATAPLSIAVVAIPPKAYFKASVITGKAPLSVTFTDSSSGAINKRYWYFGDNSVVDSVSVSPVHVYSTEGSFDVKLVVLDGSGKRADSLTVSVRTYTDNPVLISGRFLPPNRVEITYSNYNGLPTGPLPAPYADSLVLWYQSHAIPLSATGATIAKKYLPTALHPKDTVTMPQPFSDSLYGFITAVHWSDGTWSKFAAGNGCLVFVKDTITPANGCTIRGTYLGTNDAAVVVDSMKSIDMSRVDSFGVWYGSAPADSVPDFSNGSATKWFKLQDLAAVIAATGKDSIVIVNPQYNTGTVKTVWCAVILKGTNDKYSIWKKASFGVGVDRPANPIKLTATAQSASRVLLSWPPAGAVDGIRIVYRATAAVPVNTFFFDTLQYSVASPAVLDTAILVSGLTPETHYYFGAQIYKNGLWSVVTQASSADAVTPQGNPVLSANLIKLDSLSFDPVTNQINVFWKVSGALAKDSLQAGISYSTTGYPDSTQVALVQKTVPVTGGSTVRTPINIADLQFNTKYYVALWESRVDGAMTPPTDSSKGTVTTPNFNWQSVTYFTKVPGDTAFAFNNSIRLITDSVADGGAVRATDKVVFQQPDPALFSGFITASIAFRFAQPLSTARFYVGLKYNALPGKYQPSDLRMYRLQDSVWTVESNVVIDAASGYISVKTNNLNTVFMLMLDTMPVTVSEHHTDNIVPENIDLYDTFYVSDNAANVTWRFMCAMGGDPFSAGTEFNGSLGYTRSGIVKVRIPYLYVTRDNGVRARLVVSDGVHTTEYDVSRQVIRLNSDYVRTEPMKWVPLRVTAKLDSPQVRYALRDQSAAALPWTYDNKKVRIFKWYPVAQNAASKQKWVEYSEDVADVFNFQCGALTWIKTRVETELYFGAGVTPPLNASYQIPLAADSNFTDMALPFKFKIKVGDILDSTRVGTLNADSLQIYKWERDTVTGVYWSKAVFIADFSIPDLADKTKSMECFDLTGYTILNPTIEPIVLRVPPIPDMMSKYNGSAQPKKKDQGGWAIKVGSRLSDGTKLSDVYCVYDPVKGAGMRFYPLSPSFSQTYVGVCDAGADAGHKKVYGHALTSVMRNGGCSYLLAFVNESPQAAAQIEYRCEIMGAVPGTMQAKIYNEATGQFENSQATVSVAAGSTQYRWLFVGSEGYLAKAALATSVTLRLIGTYPNPFTSSVRIRYNLPTAGINMARFTICDLRGAVIWRKTVIGHGNSGTEDLVWNANTEKGRRTASGIYLLRMTAYDVNQHQTGMFERKMTLLP